MSNNLSRDLIAAIASVVDDVGLSTGSEAANIAMAGLRARAGDSIFPSIYRLDAERLWLVAQAGYTGVFDGIWLDRGVMARTVKTGETQFVADSSEIPDYLFAQPGFVSEVTCLRDDLLLNIEATEPLELSIVEPFEEFATFMAERVRSDGSVLSFETVAPELGPMISLDRPEMIAEYAARTIAVHLELDLCQAVVFEAEPLVATWRHPETPLQALPPELLEHLVNQKRAYVSWVGPSGEIDDAWTDAGQGLIVPVQRRGRLVGGLVGAGPRITPDENMRELLVAVSNHTSACLERVALEQQLKKTVYERSRFMAVVSHELRTPLTAIVGFADVLLANPELTPEERTDFLEAIQKSSGDMLELIGDILEVARAEAGQLEVRLDDVVDLADVATEAMRHIQPQAHEADTQIRMEFPADTVVLGDRVRIRQVVVNLLSNAVKFTRGGSVDVTAASDGETVSLVVADNGDGIDPDVMETLFEPFTGHSVTVPGSGSGLGLVISRQLARAMLGDLTLHSDGVGKGSRAKLHLRAYSPGA